MIHQLMLLDTKLRVLKEALPETSRAAFEAVDLTKERARVLALVSRAGSYGLTADEAEAMRGVPRGHQRFAELRRMKKIVWNGLKRPTRSGRQARVYVAR